MTIKLSVRNALYFGIFYLAIYLIFAYMLQNQPTIDGIFIYAMITLLYSVVALSLFFATKRSKHIRKKNPNCMGISNIGGCNFSCWNYYLGIFGYVKPKSI